MLKRLMKGLIVLLILALGAAFAWAEYQLQKTLDQKIQQLAPDANIQYKKVAFAPWLDAMIENIAIQSIYTDEAIRIKNLRVHQLQHFQHSPPSSIQLTLHDVRIPLVKTGKKSFLWQALQYNNYYLSAKTLSELGYAQIVADVFLHMQPLEIAEQWRIQLQIRSRQIGNIKLDIELHQLNLQNPNWLNVKFKYLVLDYQAGSLWQKWVMYLAQQQQTTSAIVRQTLANKVLADLRSMALKPSDTLALQAILRDFSPFRLSLKPQQTIDLNQLIRLQPQQGIARLQLSLSLLP
jgi:hypothetical protein